MYKNVNQLSKILTNIYERAFLKICKPPSLMFTCETSKFFRKTTKNIRGQLLLYCVL